MKPHCDAYVPGVGDPAAHFHVIGDNPTVHGGLESQLPFSGKPWSDEFFETLTRGGLLQEYDTKTGDIDAPGTFFSYLSMCPQLNEDESSPSPSIDQYGRMEPFFDAELRAITAHVLLPVGPRATKYVLDTYSAIATDGDFDMAGYQGRELKGSGWLIVPLADPSGWDDTDREEIIELLEHLLGSDYRQISDLGRFLPDETPYFVR